MTALVLASASPQRRALLAQMGIDCKVVPADIDESPGSGETAMTYTRRLAQDKAVCCAQQIGVQGVVLAADTAISLDDKILGKPRDKSDALAMLAMLSGRQHRVITSYAILNPHSLCVESCVSTVWFAHTSAREREVYWQSGEPSGKAGAYAIQGLGALFVERIEGSYSNIVGLPLHQVARALRVFNIDPLLVKEQ